MLWQYGLDWLLIVAGAVGVAYCSVILRLYWDDKRARHIAALALSWCTLSALAIVRVVQGALAPPVEMFVLFAFAVGDYGLIVLWSGHWKRRCQERERKASRHWHKDEKLEGPFEE
jgi:thiosulfate reductase cytochrome b subunit